MSDITIERLTNQITQFEKDLNSNNKQKNQQILNNLKNELKRQFDAINNAINATRNAIKETENAIIKDNTEYSQNKLKK